MLVWPDMCFFRYQTRYAFVWVWYMWFLVSKSCSLDAGGVETRWIALGTGNCGEIVTEVITVWRHQARNLNVARDSYTDACRRSWLTNASAVFHAMEMNMMAAFLNCGRTVGSKRHTACIRIIHKVWAPTFPLKIPLPPPPARTHFASDTATHPHFY